MLVNISWLHAFRAPGVQSVAMKSSDQARATCSGAMNLTRCLPAGCSLYSYKLDIGIVRHKAALLF